MAGAWNLLKRIGLRKIDEVKDSYQKGRQERVDRDLPLGIRIGGIVEIPEVDFILGGDNLKIKHPGSSNVVSSYGSYPVGDSRVHRFYLDAQDLIYILQIVTDRQKAVEECKLFMPYDEVYPDDWDFWLGERDGYIGYEIFQTQDGVQYFRVWGSDEASVVVEEDEQGNQITRIQPFEFIETIHLTPYGDQNETVKYDSMLYGRHVNENVDEYLIVSAVNEKDGASVQIMVGIELQPASIKVI
ncbi:MAG: DUF2491 family protein [Desulfomonile tiedjei]|uniref:DUF2491 family protein n=1 Tax=Desulfomonile tiedjei TaxID=2358 RepID=A0A9D6V6X6_9BACT|nr:DUF2491 family protein [Desulfomonile tiedjei]